MSTTNTYDADGVITATEIKPNTVTISYGRKVPRDGGYGSGEECSIFQQVDVGPDDSPEQVEAAVKAAFAFGKAVVLQQLGCAYGVDQETGVVNGLDSAAASAAAPVRQTVRNTERTDTRSGPVAKSYGDGVKRSKEELITELQSNPGQFFDNRVGKKNPKGPDFKRKSSGEGLWLSDLESAGVSV